MQDYRHAICLLLLGLVSLSLAMTVTVTAEPKELHEARFVAKQNSDGSILIGWQYRFGEDWSAPIIPARHRLPAKVAIGRWSRTSSFAVPAYQVKVEIVPDNLKWTNVSDIGHFNVRVGSTWYSTGCTGIEIRIDENSVQLPFRRYTYWDSCDENVWAVPSSFSGLESTGSQDVRVYARKQNSGLLELAYQHRAAGAWQTAGVLRSLQLPLPMDIWMETDAFPLPHADPLVQATLRAGAIVETIGTEFRVDVDGTSYVSRCGTLQLDADNREIMVFTRNDRCERFVGLTTVCSAEDVGTERCDFQRNQEYVWETRQLSDLDRIAISFDEYRTIDDALAHDYRPGGWLHSYGTGFANATHYLRTLIHEKAHALVDILGSEPASGHGGAFVATLLELWRRYMPHVDVQSAYQDAVDSGLEVDPAPPMTAVSDDGIQAVREIVCGGQIRSEEYCGTAR